MRVRMKDIVSVSSNVDSKVLGGIGLTLSSTITYANWITLASVVPRLSTLASLYRQYYLNSVKFSFIPGQGDSAGGNFSMGVDQAVNAAAPNTLGQVYRHVPSALMDIKDHKTIMWTGKSAWKNDLKYCAALTGLDEEALSFGVFQYYGANSVANTTVGIIEIEVDITFSSPS